MRSLTGWVVLLSAGGCGSAPLVERSAITNGTPDSGDAAVLALVLPDGSTLCSGSLIAPYVAITAAHCLEDPFDVAATRVLFGSSAAAGGTYVSLAEAHAHPAWNPQTFANDFALLTLAQRAPVDPIALDARAVDASWVGQTFAVVGFGSSAGSVRDEGTKRTGTAKVSAVSALDFTATPSPSQPCSADSGGAALFTTGGGTVLTGVTSHGDGPCVDHASFGRIDAVAAGFIQPWLQSIASGSASTGQRCYFAEQCASSSCLQATDEPSRSYCGQACQHDGDCPKGMTCATDGCRWPPPSPGALGAACAQDGDCVSAICYQGRCTRSCVPVGQTCPDGYECKNTTDIDFRCLRKPSGCAFGGGGSGGGWALALLLLAIVRRRRCA